MVWVHASAFLSFDVVILSVSPWYNELRTFMNSSISNLYFHHGFRSGKMSLLLDIGMPNFGIQVYHHETTRVHS